MGSPPDPRNLFLKGALRGAMALAAAVSIGLDLISAAAFWWLTAPIRTGDFSATRLTRRAAPRRGKAAGLNLRDRAQAARANDG
jgi:hypothetical protein